MLKEAKLDSLNENRLQDAISLHQEGHADQAIIQYKLILNSYPEHAMVHHLLGITLAQCGEIKRALSTLNRANELQPNHPIYLSSLANAYRRNADNEQAILYFEQALKLNPNLVSAHNNLALIFFKSEPNRAEKHFRAALDVMPEHVDANYNLGLLLSNSNKHKAKDYFERACHSDHAFIPARYQLAQLYHSEKSFRKALKWYQAVVALDADHANALSKIGLIYLEQDDTDRGLDFLERAHRLDPDLDDIHHNLACVYHHLKRYDDAVKHWLKYSMQQPDLTTTYNIGVCYLYLCRYQDAQDHLFEVIRQSPKHYHALVNLGATFLQCNKHDLAIEYYQRAQAITPNAAVEHVLSALTQCDSNNTSAPASYVVDLFDNYAMHYDNHLNDVLDYQLPKRIAHLIPSMLHLSSGSCITLDLGCGTGLCAKTLRDVSKTLIGIDLSSNMLAQAEKKSLYDQLVCQDITQFMPAHEDKIDLALCADTLPYIGELESLFSTVSRYMSVRGYWMFSIEECFDIDYTLNKNARYAHSQDYIRRLCTQYRLEVFHHERLALRTQQNAYVDGVLFILRPTHSEKTTQIVSSADSG
jgi:predicted TPR repeat methyltransferase/thioredoxin-like negative regulator of GroEL